MIRGGVMEIYIELSSCSMNLKLLYDKSSKGMNKYSLYNKEKH